tara:strand:- start:731 stop:850 length:120 start_codon:yes stop_codon:yes gene_type:complete
MKNQDLLNKPVTVFARSMKRQKLAAKAARKFKVTTDSDQ